MRKSLIALAFGTFALGITEYVMMGILPYIATDFHVSVSEAGYFISAYALGVCAGAPLVAVFCRKWPLKKILYLLVGVMLSASLCMTLCPIPTGEDSSIGWQFWLMMAFRFLAGTPHGAFFGVGSIVADRLSKGNGSVFAVAVMCSGMTVANLVGIPLGTFLTGLISWRLVFAFATIWNVLTMIAVVRWIPRMDALPDTGVKGAFRFLKTLAPWLLILATIFGNGGVFCWYSYIAPTLTDLGGVPKSWMTGMMALAGAGMVVGNIVGGKLSDRFGPGHTCRSLEVTLFISLVLIALTAQWMWCSIPLMFITAGCLFAVSSPQQLLLLRFSKGGELMGGAMIQLAFNLGNAVGAFFGGLPINESNPQTYHYPAAIGAVLAFFGVICYIIFCKRYEKRLRRDVTGRA